MSSIHVTQGMRGKVDLNACPVIKWQIGYNPKHSCTFIRYSRYTCNHHYYLQQGAGQNRTSSGINSLFWTSWDQILSLRSGIFTEVFCGFLHFVHANSEMVPHIRPRPLDSTCYKIHYPIIILKFDCIIRATETLHRGLNESKINKRFCISLSLTFADFTFIQKANSSSARQ
jgi:hypothetical protein